MYTADDERLRVFDYAKNISRYRVRDLGGRVLGGPRSRGCRAWL